MSLDADQSGDKDCDDKANATPPASQEEPLRVAIAQWHQRLTSEAFMLLSSGLRSLAGKVRVGTGFSGSEIVTKVFRELESHWEKVLGIKLEVELTFACELDDDKAAWLQAAHP